MRHLSPGPIREGVDPMFRSMLAGRSRRKAAIVAGVLAGVVTPLAAHASLTISMSLSPTVAGIGTTPTIKYLDPTQSADIPVYVYATVTGTNAADFQALQYAYYNINNALTNTGGASVDSVQPAASAAFQGGFGGLGTSSQIGTVANVANGVSVGAISTDTNLSDMAKARVTADGAVFGTAGTSATFLLETLNLKPVTYSQSTVVGTTVTLNATRFFAAAPTAAGFAAQFGPEFSAANWNEDSTNTTVQSGTGTDTNPNGSQGSQRHQTTATVVQDPTAGTYSTTSASPAGITIVDSMSADLNHDGSVNGADFNILTANFNKPGTYSQGDITGDGNVNGADFNVLTSEFNKTLTTTNPNVQAADLSPLAAFAASIGDTAGFDAAVGVPEPTSIALLAIGGAALLGRRKRKA